MEKQLSDAIEKGELQVRQSRPWPQQKNEDLPSNNQNPDLTEQAGVNAVEGWDKECLGKTNCHIGHHQRQFNVHCEFLDPTSNFCPSYSNGAGIPLKNGCSLIPGQKGCWELWSIQQEVQHSRVLSG